MPNRRRFNPAPRAMEKAPCLSAPLALGTPPSVGDGTATFPANVRMDRVENRSVVAQPDEGMLDVRIVRDLARHR